MSKKQTYFSLFDGMFYLETGRNSLTKKQAILDGIEYAKIDSTSPSKLDRMSLKDKEEYLEASMDIVVEEHDLKISEENDDN